MNIGHKALKEKIIHICLTLEDMDYFVGTWGNVSARVPEGVIVTPSKIKYSEITVDDFVTVSYEGVIIEGNRLPTSEAEIHRAIMNKKPRIGAAVHSHSPFATAVSCLNKPIPPFVEDLAQIAGGQVECTRYVPAGQHDRIAAEVAETIGDSDAVLLANHGAICCGRYLDEALLCCQIVEKAAMMMLAASALGKVVEIPQEYVNSERHRFLYKYGTQDDLPG